MPNDIQITEVMLTNNELIPSDVIPGRYAIATNILCTIKTDKGIGFLLLNSEPEISNTWYPLYSTINSFHTFKSDRYKSLVDEFSFDIISGVEKNRVDPTVQKFSKEFNCGEVSIENMHRNEYWLKYSKSSNVWTIYLFEFYVISALENKNGLLSCLDSNKILLPIDGSQLSQILEDGKLNNIPIVENVKGLLKDDKSIMYLLKKAI